MFHVQPEDGHYQEPKHVVVPYVENILYSTNKYSCVRRVHTLYSSYVHHTTQPNIPHDNYFVSDKTFPFIVFHFFFSITISKESSFYRF